MPSPPPLARTARTAGVGRWSALLGVLACVAYGGAFAACSSDAATGDEGDASADVTLGDDGGDDGAILVDSSGGGDARAEASGGHCSAVRGPCDVVLQDCPTGKECGVVRGGSDPNGLTTACVTAGTGSKPAGASCCPDKDNQCVAGLVCVGPDCNDASATPTGRCAPHCCQGDDSVCGASVPEGFQGTCDLGIVEDPGDGGAIDVFNVCSYKGTCKPFHVLSCPPNYSCLLQKDGVSFRCTSIFSPPGNAVGTTCNLANDCADGLLCLGPPDASTSKCAQTCFRADAAAGAPFDASALRDAAGYGGCPGGLPCNGTIISGAPPYLGFCP